MVIFFGCLFAVVAIPHVKIAILKSRYYRTERGMTENQVRSIMGSFARPHQTKGGILYWGRDLAEESRTVVSRDGITVTVPRTSSRVEKTVIYRVNAIPFHVCFQFMFDAQDKLIGRHIHDYD